MIKTLIVLISILCFCSFTKAQKLDVEMLDAKIVFPLKNPNYTPVTITYSIKNNTSDPICFVLDKNNFGLFENPNEYFFNESDNNKLFDGEKIFNARLLLFDSEKRLDNLELNIPSACYIAEELTRLINLQNEIDEDSLKILKVYQSNFFKKKPLNWVVRAKYVNDNIVFLKPFETIKINTKIDFRFYEYNEIYKSLNGYHLEYKNYKMQIKIYNNPSIINEYLTDHNREKVKEINAKFVDGINFSNKIDLKVTEK